MGTLSAGMRFKSWVSNRDGGVVRSGFQRMSPMARDFIFRVKEVFGGAFFLSIEENSKEKKASCNPGCRIQSSASSPPL